MGKVMKTCFASVVSELQQSDIYMTVKARLFETPRANLNGARVTPAFLAEIVENQEKYVGLPLCADVKALANGRYDHLGHLYDARTGEFHSTQIGSFYKYEQEDFDGGSYLIGYARIMKRNKAVCKAIAELFAENALKFSFEITCGNYTELEDGTIQIDASSENFLEGAAIVTFPACEDAVALELVAECNNIDIIDDFGKGENEMTDVKESAEVVAEEQVEEPVSEEQEEVQAECEKQKEETAQVYVTEEHTETSTVCAYDSETGADVCQQVTVTTRSSTVEDGNIIAENNDNENIAEVVVADGETPEEETPEEDTSDPAEGAVTEDDDNQKKTAELIAELVEEIKTLKNEISEMKETQQQIIASKQERVSVNPFIAEINTPNKYSLLDKAEPAKSSSYSLLDKA